MSQEPDLFPYDEQEAVAFIRNFLPQECKDKFTDDQINYIIDVIYEYYDEKGFLSEGNDEEAEIDEDDLIAFVQKNASKDGLGEFDVEEIAFVVQGELAYCDSLGLFE